MQHRDFTLGMEFLCSGKRWRCTDIGTRTVIAICLDDHPGDPSWYHGPPYAVAESVFNEDDLPTCDPVRRDI
ncbi:MAG: hypothetical protein O7G88_08105 [bacterium]|nr:hypothetical protein [bacterium]